MRSATAIQLFLAYAFVAGAAVELGDVMRKIGECMKRAWRSLPMTRLRMEYMVGRERAERIEAKAAEQQHEIAKRVHVLEWLAFPRVEGSKRKGPL